jgi:hypothetical protein
VSWQEYRDLRERLTIFPELLAQRMAPFTLGDPGRSVRIYGMLVSGNYFSALGMRPALGRFFRPDEAARPGGEPVAVVSHDFWQTRLGGAADVVGRTLRVNDQQVTVVGVTPERFQGTTLGLNFDLWVPATMAPLIQGGSRELDDRTMRGYMLMGKLPAGTTIAQAQAQLDAAMHDLAVIYPETNATLRGEVLPFWQAPRGPQRMLATSLGILQAIMLVLLLAVCGNTANLVLARASARHREVGVRLALGAARTRIAGLILGENLLLGLMGAALGVAIALWATDAMRAVPIIGSFPIRFQTDLDLGSLGFAILLGIVCGLIFGAARAAKCARRCRGRARSCRAAGRGALLAQLQRDARRRPRVHARRGAARELRLQRAKHRPGCRARIHGTPARRAARDSLGRRRRDCRRRSARHSRPAAALVRDRRESANRPGARSGAQQHRDARLPPHHGHPPPRGT